VWIAFRIAVLYGAPVVAVAAAIAYLVALRLRVRRGALGRARAAALCPLALLLAPVAVAAIWATAELASYFSVPAGSYAWDAAEALALLDALLPIAAYVGIAIAVLVVVFWITLAAWKRSS
jgi:hypothetical protein